MPGSYSLPNPSSPNTSDALTSLPIRQNFQSLQGQINNADGAALQTKTVPEAALSDAINPRLARTDSNVNYVASGLVISVPGSGFIVTIPSGIAYVLGVRVVYAGGTITCAASQDTYIDISTTGVIAQPAVTNNTVSPALTANSIRLAIAIANGTGVTTINQGATTAVLPIVSSIAYSVTDGLGNLIYPTSPNPVMIGYRQIVTDFTTTNATATDITGLNVTCIIPAGRRVKVTGFIGTGSVSISNNAVAMYISDVTAGVQITEAINGTSASGDSCSVTPTALVSPIAGARTYKAQMSRGVNAATAHSNGNVVDPNYIIVELVL